MIAAGRTAITKAVDDDDLPPYSELPQLHVLPSYLSACPLKPYRPLPNQITAYQRLSQFYSITLCGLRQNDRLYYVEPRRGYDKIEPLGSRAGILLRNGLSSRSEVLAAAGEESPWAKYYKNPTVNSVFFLPPFEFGTNSRAMPMETMRMGDVAGGGVTFTFFTEVEPIKDWKRQKFQWVQNPECVERFELLRVLRSRVAGAEDGTELECVASSSSAMPRSNAYGETVATLIFCRQFRSPRELFTLTMLGSAEDCRLGERCTIVITALWIWGLQKKRGLHSLSYSVSGPANGS
ncbi:hypothetical protein QQS21_005727 [Conoideocrella luteorostrata]|uniref:Uncharacterized protein n=1 Tax=Conoideocrella luteorostrata TaxID=1105319 RepID=A0AAJ0FTK8_9HYPO|nr:hypothetical protein QQS21_005727 [Conoideocrella luteorostrata]